MENSLDTNQIVSKINWKLWIGLGIFVGVAVVIIVVILIFKNKNTCDDPNKCLDNTNNCIDIPENNQKNTINNKCEILTDATTTTTTTTPASTNLAPTTPAPITSAPTTLAPTTLAPTTLAPTTLAPTTTTPAPVPINCQLSAWSDWSNCLNSQQTRTRIIQVQPQNGGTPCEPLIETRTCNNLISNQLIGVTGSTTSIGQNYLVLINLLNDGRLFLNQYDQCKYQGRIVNNSCRFSTDSDSAIFNNQNLYLTLDDTNVVTLTTSKTLGTLYWDSNTGNIYNQNRTKCLTRTGQPSGTGGTYIVMGWSTNFGAAQKFFIE
jgi:hypothetical protein